jgi:hypothetical protein
MIEERVGLHVHDAGTKAEEKERSAKGAGTNKERIGDEQPGSGYDGEQGLGSNRTS